MPSFPQRLPARLPTSLARTAVALTAFVALSLAAAEEPILKVVFDSRSVVVSGKIGSEESAELISASLRSARPDLSLDQAGLVVDTNAALSDLGELPSLLAELGLSTHEGRLELWPDRLVIGGLTDSLVTQSALRIRAKPLLAGRVLHNRLCIVGTDDLPKLEVSLSATSGTVAPVPSAPLLVAAPVGSFEMPGLSFPKLLAVIRLPGQIDRLSGKPPSTPSPVRVAGEMQPALAASAPVATLTATPVENLEPLPSVLFSRNSFLLQANQQSTIEALVKHLLSPDRRGAPVRIEAVKASGGSAAFNEYLCDRRGAEVARFLTEGGVEATTLQVRTIGSNSPIDEGEVRVSVEILPPPAPPMPEAATGGTPVGTPAPAEAPKPIP